MTHLVPPQSSEASWKLSMALLLLVVSRRGAARPAAGLLGSRRRPRPVGVGLLLFGGTAMVFALGMIVPATHDAFLDTRIGGATLLTMLFVVLVQIPLGTVVLEEVAFRGVLPALMGGAPAIRWRWLPVLCASVAFGLWHILPSMGIGNANSAVGETIGTNPWVTTTAAVLSMTAAGV